LKRVRIETSSRAACAAGEKYTLHVKEIATGKRLLKEPIPVRSTVSVSYLRSAILLLNLVVHC
jgi:hypothetical protein